nr:zinc ribbon domain-containing protein [Bacillus cereus]
MILNVLHNAVKLHNFLSLYTEKSSGTKVMCNTCRTQYDRDINASINLKNEAIRFLTVRNSSLLNGVVQL